MQEGTRLADRLVASLEAIENTPHYQRACEGKPHAQHSTYVRTAATTLRSLTAIQPCPTCGGVYEPSMENDPCSTCGDRGYLTAPDGEAA
jgi:hypothetical protein